MKKYLGGFMAIALAVVLFAFTSRTHVPQKQSTTDLFWYEYDAVNDQLGALLNPNSSVKIAKSAVETDCQDDLFQPDCVRGYDENTRAFQSHPPTPIDAIKETDQSGK
jgi:hypothetical protein